MSSILKGFKTVKGSACGLYTVGCCCLPFLCAGLVCCIPAVELSYFKELYENVIKIYGGEKELTKLGDKVKKQRNIFRNAVTQVNSTCKPAIIKADVTLYDVICHADPRVGQLIKGSDVSSLLDEVFRSALNKEYYDLVWTAYKELGGNYHVVVYGLIEYMCQMYDPTCEKVKCYLNLFTSDTSLRVECLAHKDLC
jgi:hypothetical protein